MKPFKILSHTADMKLQVSGHTPEELFQNAAFALAAILVKGVEAIKRRGDAEKIVLAADGIEALLVNFLNEILTRSQINKKVYTIVKILRLSSKSLDAQIFGVPIDGFDEDVKAVTHHNVEIKKKRGILQVELVLDI